MSGDIKLPLFFTHFWNQGTYKTLQHIISYTAVKKWHAAMFCMFPDSKSEWKKGATGQSFIPKEITSYRIGTLIPHLCVSDWHNLVSLLVYIEAGRSTTSTTLTFTTASTSGITWKAKVTQIECYRWVLSIPFLKSNYFKEQHSTFSYLR